MGFMGYLRPDGKVGVRNHVVVMSSVSCANGVAEAVAREVPGLKAVTHTEGCGRGMKDLPVTMRTLTGLGRNPNVAAVLVVGLGCEFIDPKVLSSEIAVSGKPVRTLVIQKEGGSQTTTRKGIEIARELLEQAGRQSREERPWSDLVLGLKCGGSDAMSGVTANPAVGAASDWLISQGGTAMLSETTEMIGTASILAARAATPEVAGQVSAMIENHHRLAKDLLGVMADSAISPGNMEGGLTTIQEKSLGCIVKGGTSPIREVLEYAAAPGQRGLVLMDSPGSDVFSMTGMAAGGAQIIAFTTGMGTPAGFPVVPVIKISSTTELFDRMAEDLDLDAGAILEGAPVGEVGDRLVALIGRVAEGKQTKTEANLQDLLAIHTYEPAF